MLISIYAYVKSPVSKYTEAATRRHEAHVQKEKFPHKNLSPLENT